MKNEDVYSMQQDGRTLGRTDATVVPPELLDITVDEMQENSQLHNNNNTIAIDWPSPPR